MPFVYRSRFNSIKWKIIASKKNPAAYQVSLSAVKKIQKEKSGMDKKRHRIPQNAVSFGSRFKINRTKTTKKAASCIFIMFFL